MDLRSNKKDKFDAFQGHSLAKPLPKMTGTTKFHQQMNDFDKYNFDESWRGSVSNLMSSENITEDLIKESLRELEKAMQESKRMLRERDIEIQKLRETIEKQMKEREREDGENYPNILNEYRESQKRVIELEFEIRELNLARSKENLRSENPPTIPESCFGSGCTCKCGSSCPALSDLNETKKNLESAKTKYDNLKRKVREFRKQVEIENREDEEKENERSRISACTLQ